MSDVLGYQDILERLPDRPPVLMLDRLEIAADRRQARAVKCMSMNEAFFLGHFPGAPIMPGVLQVAAMAQLGTALLAANAGADAGAIRVVSIGRVKFRRPVLPGDQLLIEAELGDGAADGGVEIRAKTSVDGVAVSQGVVTLRRSDAATGRSERLDFAPDLPAFPQTETAIALATGDITESIPHRFPFLLVDRIPYLDVAACRAVGIKNVTGNEPYMTGLASANMPGYLQVEAAAQVACALALRVPSNKGKLGYFMSIDSARFLQPVVPGDRLVMDLNVVDRGRFGLCDGVLSVGSARVTEVELKFAIVDRPNP